MATKREVLDQAARGEGALGRAADDETVFVLRAQDKLAAAFVLLWADLAEKYGGPADKVADARAISMQMLAWPKRKYPD